MTVLHIVVFSQSALWCRWWFMTFDACSESLRRAYSCERCLKSYQIKINGYFWRLIRIDVSSTLGAAKVAKETSDCQAVVKGNKNPRLFKKRRLRGVTVVNSWWEEANQPALCASSFLKTVSRRWRCILWSAFVAQSSSSYSSFTRFAHMFARQSQHLAVTLDLCKAKRGHCKCVSLLAASKLS